MVNFADYAAPKTFAASMAFEYNDILMSNDGIIKRVPAADHPGASWDQGLRPSVRLVAADTSR